VSNGQSWATAFKTLQGALAVSAVCANITEVWVAKGVYYLDEGTGQTNDNLDATFYLASGVAIYGGFALPAQRASWPSAT
jgi:hypothetical protein